MKLIFYPPNTAEFVHGQSVVICGDQTYREVEKFAINILKQIDSPVYEFAIKVAKAMNEIKSSNVYFIMQQAYGEIDWSEVEGIFTSVLENTTTNPNKP
jgi:cystathionine beta-lyase family protein involved in aluminum resistance